MLILIYLLTFLTTTCQAQSLGNERRLKPQYRSKPQLPNYNQEQGKRNMNYMQRDYTKPKQLPMGDAMMLMTSRMNNMQRMRDRDMFMRRGDRDNREGKMPTWGVPRAKDRIPVYTGTNVPTNTEVPVWTMKWSKYIDMPLNNRAVSNNTDTGMKRPRWSKDIDTSLGNRARVTVDNPALKLQVNSARRSYNHDIPLFEKPELPTDELRKTLKNIDEQLSKYKNGIYKMFKPNYLHDNPNLEAIKKQDLPIDAKVHTLLKTLKADRKGEANVPLPEDISDISI